MKADSEIDKNAVVKAYLYGDTVELSTSNINNHQQSILVISDHRYVDLTTGEIKQMNTNANSRVGNLSSVKRTMHSLRRLIANNFDGGNDQLWITLTYGVDINAHNLNDTKVVYQDFKNFISKLRKVKGRLEYIAVIEPQLSGRWHLHLLLKTLDGEELYIPNNIVQKLWCKGFTKTKRLFNSDNVASYVMAYLSDLKVNSGNQKVNAKGARLYMYPKGIRIYRRSKGIKDPVMKTDIKQRLLNQYDLSDKDRRATYERSFSTKDGKKIVNKNEFYNKKGGNDDDKVNSD
ncbi:replicative protein [Limosilactobacillus reuteri]|uniref:rolling circle replication-associated protein n=1 Tax=Limosilactobacillus reuteri TaxID=1598 RepID=UPI001E63BAAD|nr:replicative protein [Limosilactobacillus reuteri]MCC4352497.1 replicative protein [Limosilactobacillus reuteri]MCC4376805.1 replicative protein [Limosilactobacillus reuteri]